MTGNFFWYELMTSDTDAAIDFYGKVVGWTAADYPNSTTPGGLRYTVLSAGERSVGGILQLDETMKGAGMKPIWVGYVPVPDVDASAARIEEAGGSIHLPPTDIPGVGRIAMAADPGGALFYVMKPFSEETPTPTAEASGTVNWHELYSSVGEKAAFAFYSGLFGWQTMNEMDMGPMGIYRIFGDGETHWGGMMDRPPEVPKEWPQSQWSFYVNVDSVDAAAEQVKANGGQVIMGPMEVPDGSWVLKGVDPQGAVFALRSLKR